MPCAMLTEISAKLLAKVVDLESRSQCNNIRFIGQPVFIEGLQPSAFFSELLAEVFWDGVLEYPKECDSLCEMRYGVQYCLSHSALGQIRARVLLAS